MNFALSYLSKNLFLLESVLRYLITTPCYDTFALPRIHFGLTRRQGTCRSLANSGLTKPTIASLRPSVVKLNGPAASSPPCRLPLLPATRDTPATLSQLRDPLHASRRTPPHALEWRSRLAMSRQYRCPHRSCPGGR